MATVLALSGETVGIVMDVGGMPHNKFLASIELLGRKVLKSATGLNGMKAVDSEGVSGHGGNRALLNEAGTFEGWQEAGPSMLERR